MSVLKRILTTVATGILFMMLSAILGEFFPVGQYFVLAAWFIFVLPRIWKKKLSIKENIIAAQTRSSPNNASSITPIKASTAPPIKMGSVSDREKMSSASAPEVSELNAANPPTEKNEIETCNTSINNLLELGDVDIDNVSDEKFYEIAQNEIDSGNIVRGLMLKAEVAVDGDTKKARLLYLQARANSLYNEELNKMEFEKRKNEEIPLMRELLNKNLRTQKLEKVEENIQALLRLSPDNPELIELKCDAAYQFFQGEYSDTLSMDKYKLRSIGIDWLREVVNAIDDFLVSYPQMTKREELEETRKRIYTVLDNKCFQKAHRLATIFVRKRKYGRATLLYREYLSNYSEHASEVEAYLEKTLPEIIEKKPPKN